MISIARDFSRSPAGRYISDGPNSGERFRSEFLLPAIKAGQHVNVELDGTRGLGSSFLEEAFGGLQRLGYPREQLLSRLSFVSSDPSLVAEIKSYWR